LIRRKEINLLLLFLGNGYANYNGLLPPPLKTVSIEGPRDFFYFDLA
jgi:hypothetical protein